MKRHGLFVGANKYGDKFCRFSDRDLSHTEITCVDAMHRRR